MYSSMRPYESWGSQTLSVLLPEMGHMILFLHLVELLNQNKSIEILTLPSSRLESLQCRKTIHAFFWIQGQPLELCTCGHYQVKWSVNLFIKWRSKPYWQPNCDTTFTLISIQSLTKLHEVAGWQSIFTSTLTLKIENDIGYVNGKKSSSDHYSLIIKISQKLVHDRFGFDSQCSWDKTQRELYWWYVGNDFLQKISDHLKWIPNPNQPITANLSNHDNTIAVIQLWPVLSNLYNITKVPQQQFVA